MHVLLQTLGTSVHWYGKQVQNKRKLGHITIIGTDNEEAHQRLRCVDPSAADAMDAASARYTEATSQQQSTAQSQGPDKHDIASLSLCLHCEGNFAH